MSIPDPTSDYGGRAPDSSAAEDDEPPSRGRNEVALTLLRADVDPPVTGWLEEQFAQVLAAAGVEGASVSLAVVDDGRMGELHERYCDEPGTTDVLSFDLRDSVEEPVEGEIVVCLDEAERQAGTRGHAARVEALLYAVHGLLHFLGEDDHEATAAARMHRRENELLTAAGFGAVYGPVRKPGADSAGDDEADAASAGGG